MSAKRTVDLKDRAEEDLRFIRDAMGRGAAFTCVPGKGGVAMGAVGLAVAALAAGTSSTREWLAVWTGLLALVLPERGDVLLGLGFGAGHVLTGLVVARRHGG